MKSGSLISLYWLMWISSRLTLDGDSRVACYEAPVDTVHNHFGTIDSGLTYTVESIDGATCILARTECLFNLSFHSYKFGTQQAQVYMPQKPLISGNCRLDEQTSEINFRWSTFNFSLVFTKNPEGNSYYLNKAILVYNQNNSQMFPDATYTGNVHLETKSDTNFYFTPLGKSYKCDEIEDQGPLNLFDLDKDMIGTMSLYRSHFQPFVRRSKGSWGENFSCLSKSIQTFRKEVIPLLSMTVFTSSSFVLLITYALYQKYNVIRKGSPYDECDLHDIKTAEPFPVINGDNQSSEYDVNKNNISNQSASNPFGKTTDRSNNPFI